MSYFHTGIRTIIGAEAFHCPVRDGKEWDHLAMVIRHNLLSARSQKLRTDQFIESSDCVNISLDIHEVLTAPFGISRLPCL